MKWILLAILPIFLSGCGAEETLETVYDVWSVPEPPAMREIAVDLPADLYVSTLEDGSGQLYLADDYEISIETLESGDLERTIRTVSGMEKGDLTVLSRQYDGMKRYDFVWASAGEQGERIGRCSILDDGAYHYTMTALRDTDQEEQSPFSWDALFQSFRLT